MDRLKKVPLGAIPVAPVDRTVYFFEGDREMTLDEMANAVRYGQIDAVTYHYSEGSPVLRSTMARGIRTMADMRRIAAGTAPKGLPPGE